MSPAPLNGTKAVKASSEPIESEAGEDSGQRLLDDRRPAALLLAAALLTVVLAGTITKFPRLNDSVPRTSQFLGRDATRLRTYARFDKWEFPPDTGGMHSPALATPASLPWLLETDFYSRGDGAIVVDWTGPSHYLRLVAVAGAAAWKLEAVDGGTHRQLAAVLARTTQGVEVMVARFPDSIRVDVDGARMSVRLRAPEGAKVGLQWTGGPHTLSHFDLRS